MYVSRSTIKLEMDVSGSTIGLQVDVSGSIISVWTMLCYGERNQRVLYLQPRTVCEVLIVGLQSVSMVVRQERDIDSI